MMICKYCGAEIPEGARFCGKCGFPVSDAGGPEPVDGVPAEAPRKKKLWIPILIVCIAAAVVVVLLLVGNLGRSRVYKYSSCSAEVTAPADGEAFGINGSLFVETFVESFLRDSYIEVHSNNDVTLLIPILGYRTITARELNGGGTGLSIAVDHDFVTVHSDVVTVIFRRATDSEADNYEHMLESATEFTEGTFDSIFGIADGNASSGIPTQK